MENQKIIAKIINNETYLSVNTIKNILYKDALDADDYKLINMKTYIKNLITRLNNMY